MTEEQTSTIEKEWAEHSAYQEWFVGGEEEYKNEKQKLQLRFGKEPSVNDVKWGLLNIRAGEQMKKGDYSALSGIYFQMALQVNDEAKDATQYQQQAQKMQLMSLKTNGLVTQVEILSKTGCEECQKINGKVFKIGDALIKMPLPVPTCTNKLNPNAPTGWCRCCYLPKIDDVL